VAKRVAQIAEAALEVGSNVRDASVHRFPLRGGMIEVLGQPGHQVGQPIELLVHLVETHFKIGSFVDSHRAAPARCEERAACQRPIARIY
jgi:hypothetical protein